MLNRPREDSMIHCASDTTDKPIRTPPPNGTKYKGHFDTQAKTEDIPITIDPLPDLCEQEKMGQDELKGMLDKNLFTI